MTASRRDFLTASAMAAAVAALPSSLLAELASPRQAGARPLLDLALRAAAWIDRSTQRTDTGLRWPADPLKPESVNLGFYNGMPGVVTYFAALHHATGDQRWLALATGGADYLIHQMDAAGDQLDGGLYTGLAGLGFTLLSVERAGGGASYGQAARRAAAQLVQRARVSGDGVDWNDSWDIVSGIAGTGLFLLEAGRQWQDDQLVALAARAGRRLIALGEPAEGGTMWYPSKTLRRNYPNFSHGTSGVGYFLATLHQRTKDRAFLDAALQGASYLDAAATRRDGGTLIFHQSGGGEGRFYLSWCHGPPGTARFFHRLHQITGERRWSDWVDSLTRGLFGMGVPEQRSEGYWNNISQCCGNSGVGQYCIDLARYRPTTAAAAIPARVVSDTMRRATDDAEGLRWVQAENRTQPENRVAQTGFMQGAAGVGTFFLQLDALERGETWRFPLPDTPFQG